LEFWLHYLRIKYIFSSIWEYRNKYSQEYEKIEISSAFSTIFRGNRRFVQNSYY
jgi:hypothetical protein